MIKKFKAFVSGNQKKLKEDRLAVKETILGSRVFSCL